MVCGNRSCDLCYPTSPPVPALRRRLLQDIAELQSKPYPNIALYVDEADITQACLILTVGGYGSMHLTVHFPNSYPLSPPTVQMNSDISHPNIFGSYICASILNTTEGYTPAYTLKGIAIQLLSFFSSDKIEQVGGGQSYNLLEYRRDTGSSRGGRDHVCEKCKFERKEPESTAFLTDYMTLETRQVLGISDTASEASSVPASVTSIGRRTVLGRNARRRKARENREAAVTAALEETRSPNPTAPKPASDVYMNGIDNAKLPDEILLLICGNLDTEDLLTFAKSWSRIGGLITNYDIIRTRELQCFTFKKDYMSTMLGIGVSVEQRGRLGFLESEFDLLSREAYTNHSIRRSVQGVPFQRWLPLAISYGHWRKIREHVSWSLSAISADANLGNVPQVQVLFHFMNDIVVKLNQAASVTTARAPYYPYEELAQSSLTHASEKAIESYFHLFHLLLCLATTQPPIIAEATRTIRSFVKGRTSKKDCPNLGHLLIAALIADIDIDEKTLKAIIRETITRNVVWMLDKKGAGMAELSYLEPAEISQYRLEQTFKASKTSYRLLMFLNLFRRAAVGSPRKPLARLRDEAFARHGAPPRGSAKKLADAIKRIHQVDNFPDFLTWMGVTKPGPIWFTAFLRKCVQDSMEKCYSKMPMTQRDALALRIVKEPDVAIAQGLLVQGDVSKLIQAMSRNTFFPGNNTGPSASGGGGKGHRGRRYGGN